MMFFNFCALSIVSLVPFFCKNIFGYSWNLLSFFSSLLYFQDGNVARLGYNFVKSEKDTITHRDDKAPSSGDSGQNGGSEATAINSLSTNPGNTGFFCIAFIKNVSFVSRTFLKYLLRNQSFFQL